jgi:hypothetical protein
MTTFLEYLNELIALHGQGTLADQVKSDGSMLCRFRSGQGSLSINTIQALLDAGKATIIFNTDLECLENALATMSDLWRQERKRRMEGRAS